MKEIVTGYFELMINNLHYAIALLLAISPVIYGFREVVSPCMSGVNISRLSFWQIIFNPPVLSIVLILFALWCFAFSKLSFSCPDQIILSILMGLLLLGVMLFLRSYIFSEVVHWCGKEIFGTIFGLFAGLVVAYVLYISKVKLGITNLQIISLLAIVVIYVVWGFLMKYKTLIILTSGKYGYHSNICSITEFTFAKFREWGYIANLLLAVVFTLVYWLLRENYVVKPTTALIILVTGTLIAIVATTLLLLDFIYPEKYFIIMKQIFESRDVLEYHHLLERKLMGFQLSVWYMVIGLYWVRFYFYKIIYMK